QAPTKGPVVSAPTRVQATAGDTVVVVVTASDADEITPPPTAGPLVRRALSLIAGAVFLTADLSDLPDGRATFTTNRQPNVSAPSQVDATEGSEVSILVSATDPDGDPILDLVALTDGLPPGNDGTFTPGPDNLTGTFTWTPAAGQTGAYTVVFRAINALVGNASTVITVASAPEALEARAFMAGKDKKVKLETIRHEACLQLEPVADFDLIDVDFGSIVMISAGTGSVSEIPAIHEKQIVVSDKDGNGAQDATLCFTKVDLRRLFSLLEGHVLVPVVIEGSLKDGPTFRAEITLDVYASSPLLASTVVPNPLNPEGALTFRTGSRGALRVTLHDASGRLIRVLMDGSADPGEHSIRIDGRGTGGTPLPSGVYFYRIESADGETAGRFAIVK
ncbi:MAG TPA: FlgD immunoglobulin-like domain containing protein, partial [Candidatus Eisenbacteria bacterium]|nr:FlgD immunoglobulin-like domain containing protein [Candidatus Eisenbacteria bacterium]